MALTLADAIVNITGDDSKLDGVLGRARQKANGFVGRVGGAIKSGLTTAVMAVGAAGLAVGGIVAGIGVKAVGMGADAMETASLLETSLGGAAESLNSELREFASNANRSFYELQEGSATFVAMTRAMGATEEQAAEMSGGFVEMATDLGSFFNIPTEQALADLQGGLAGSSETMQKYGIDIRETTLKQMALDQGLIDSASDTIPRLVRAQLIQQAITEQAADAMGDAERTSGSWSNMLRGLQGRLRDTATDIGLKLIPVLEPLLTGFMNLVDQGLDVLMPALETALGIFGRFTENLAGGMEPIDAIRRLIMEVGRALGMSVPEAAALRDRFSGLVEKAQALWEKLTTLLEPVWEAITGFVSWKDVLLVLGGALVVAAALIIGPIVLAVAKVGLIIAGVIAVVALLRNAWESDWLGIRSALMEVYNTVLEPLLGQVRDWLATAIPAAMETLKGFWEGTLRPAFQAIGDFIQNVLIPAYINYAQWMGENIPKAMQAVRDFWESTLQPALQAIQAFIVDTVIPAISDFVTWLSSNLTEAFTTVKSFWEGTLQPALQALWDFITDDVVPVIESFIGVLEEVANIGMTAIQGAWENILKPALDALWGFIQNDVVPILEDLWGVMEDVGAFIEATLSPIINTLVDGALAGLRGAFDNIKTALSGLKDLFDRFKESLAGFTLPAFLTPGSPTPFENGLRGILSAMEEINRAQLPAFGDALSGMRSPLPPGAVNQRGAAAGGGGVTQNNFFENLNLYGVQDAEGLLAALEELRIGST